MKQQKESGIEKTERERERERERKRKRKRKKGENRRKFLKGREKTPVP